MWLENVYELKDQTNDKVKDPPKFIYSTHKAQYLENHIVIQSIDDEIYTPSIKIGSEFAEMSSFYF